jgi:hypothetical protein
MGGEDLSLFLAFGVMGCAGPIRNRLRSGGGSQYFRKGICLFYFSSRYRDTRVIGVFYKAKMHYSRRKNSDLICMKCYDDFRPCLKTTTLLPQNIPRERNIQREKKKRKQSPRYPKGEPHPLSAVRFVVRKEKKREWNVSHLMTEPPLFQSPSCHRPVSPLLLSRLFAPGP